MKLAYVTTYDARFLGTKGFKEWSGTGYYIAQSLKNSITPDLEYLGPLERSIAMRSLLKMKRHYHEFFGKTYIKDVEPLLLKNYADRVAKKLSTIKADLVFSATINPVAYLECEHPIAFWADATFANLIDFYPQYSNLCDESITQGHLMEKKALQSAKLAIYASEWAAQTAINYYQADPAKVKVVPFGANIESSKSLHEIKEAIDAKPSNKCKLLFLAVDWLRKGGDVAFEVVRELNNLGLNAELTVIGCQPGVKDALPTYVKPLGFISKSTPEGKQKIDRAIAESHFLILPSLADCSPIVLCEANSLGTPCLATKVGGIPTIIRDDLNGRTFDLKADVREYCNYIIQLFSNYNQYKQLALSSFNEYQSRLNWSFAGQSVRELLETLKLS
jgi:glycosyltransferase involved in cell wall biosynthesis